MINVLDITAIEEALCNAVRKAGITEPVYTSRPNATANTADAFIVVHVSGNVVDSHALARCVASVNIFVRDIGGFKNTKKISLMYKTLVRGLALEDGALMFSNTPRIIAETPDSYGYHVRILNIDTTIKVNKIN